MLKAENGIIRDVNLTIENYGMLMLEISLDLQQGGAVVFGGYCLYNGNNRDDSNTNNYAGEYIVNVLRTVGVERLKDLVNQPVRVLFKDRICVGIQHFLSFSKYFIPNTGLTEEDIKTIL